MRVPSGDQAISQSFVLLSVPTGRGLQKVIMEDRLLFVASKPNFNTTETGRLAVVWLVYGLWLRDGE